MKTPSINDLQCVYDRLYTTKEEAVSLLDRAIPKKSDKDLKLFFQQILMTFGSIQLIAGVLFFFAYNWTAIHRFGKLGIAAGIITIICIGSQFIRKEDWKWKLTVGSAQFLTGVLLALWGQIYQTGADSYLLFLLWAILTIPFAIVGKSKAIWSIWMIILNLAVILHAEQVLENCFSLITASVLIAINGIALYVYDLVYRKDSSASRLLPGIITTILLVWLTSASIIEIIDSSEITLVTILFIATIVALFTIYSSVSYSLGQVALALFAVVTFIYALCIQNILEIGGDAGSFLLLGIILIALIAGALGLLLNIRTRQSEREVK